jgi:serine protease Do
MPAETNPRIAEGRSKASSRLRTTLLSSTAALAIAALVGGSLGLGGGMVSLTGPSMAQAAGQSTPTGFADLVAKVKPAVISVRVEIERESSANDNDNDNDNAAPPRNSPFYRFFFGPNGQQQPRQQITGEGSGFFISSDGYAVTNNHVVDHANTVQVTTDDGTIYTAKVMGTDPKTDLALIKVDGNNKQFAFAQFADEQPRVGDWVIAVGNPFGLGGTVTAGIVSASGREIGASPYDDYLQIDAPINKGNSGGPAFGMNGKVIGVNSAIVSPSGGSVGIGFDIPADTAKLVVDQLRQKGSVTRGWLGVQVQPVTVGIADSMGLNKAEGALVDQPEPGSPAEKAGIKAGDIITAVNDTPIKDARALAQHIARAAPGSSAKLSVIRDGKTDNINVTLATMPKQQQEAESQPQQQQQQEEPRSEQHLGMSLAPAQDVEGSGRQGVVVLGVDPSGPAAQNGVETGDVILDVSGKSVQTPSQVREAINQTRSQGRRSVLMRVKSAQGTKFVALPIAQG